MIIVIVQNPDDSFGCITEGGDGPAVVRAALTAVRDQLDQQFPELAKAAGEKPPPAPPRLYLPNGGPR